MIYNYAIFSNAVGGYGNVALLLHILVYARFKEWWAGYTYGPRYFSDALPALTIFLVYGLVPYCRWQAMRVLAAVLALYGVAVQAIGAYAADDGWNREPTPLERAPWRVWDWGDLQIVRSARNGLHPGELSRVIVDTIRDSSAVRVAPLEGAQLAGPIAPLHLPRQPSRSAARGTRRCASPTTAASPGRPSTARA